MRRLEAIRVLAQRLLTSFRPFEKSGIIAVKKNTRSDPELKDAELSTLVGGIVQDTTTLLTQQIELLRAELVQELRRAGGGVASLAAGGGLVAAGGLLSGMTLAHLLHRSTRLPLWLCYGAVAGGLGATGLGLLVQGRESIAQAQLVPPPETAAALKENVEWAKKQIGLDST